MFDSNGTTAALQARFGNIPNEFKNSGGWAVSILGLDGKLDKRPVHPGSRFPLAVDKPGSWATFEECAAAVLDPNHPAVEMGRLEDESDDFVLIDLDSPRDEESRRIVQAIIEGCFGRTYIEISQSGNGYHVLVRGKLPNDKGRRQRHPVELYSHRRYVITTGKVLYVSPFSDRKPVENNPLAATGGVAPPAAPCFTIEPMQAALNFLLAEMGPVLEDVEIKESLRTDDEAREWADYILRHEQSDKLRAMMDEPPGPNWSDSDMRLVEEIVFRMQHLMSGETDAKVLVNVFSGSKHWRGEGSTEKKRGYEDPAKYVLDYLIGRTYAHALDMRRRTEEDRTRWAEVYSRVFEVFLQKQDVPLVVPPVQPWEEPLPLWGAGPVPKEPPQRAVPPVIRDFAITMGKLIGVDPGPIVMAALGALAGALPDAYTLQMKANNTRYHARARLWVMLVGKSSAKKSPVIDAVFEPLDESEGHHWRKYEAALAAAETKEQKAAVPIPEQLIINNATVEALIDVLRINLDGAILRNGELSGWFGSMGAYGNNAASKDRAEWLHAYDGGPRTVNRRNRGPVGVRVENMSCGMVGGIQPDKIAEQAQDSEDGLLPRILPVMMEAPLEDDDAIDPSAHRDAYENMARFFLSLRGIKSKDGRTIGMRLRLSPEAQAVRTRLGKWRTETATALEDTNSSLASHINKYEAVFGSLCVLYHCIRHVGAPELPTTVAVDTAEMAEALIQKYIFPHAVRFYLDVLVTAKSDSALKAVADLILGRKLERIVYRDLQKGTRETKGLSLKQADEIFALLTSFGWLRPVPGRQHNNHPYEVNPLVHEVYAERAAQVAEKQRRAYAVMKDLKRVQ